MEWFLFSRHPLGIRQNRYYGTTWNVGWGERVTVFQAGPGTGLCSSVITLICAYTHGWFLLRCGQSGSSPWHPLLKSMAKGPMGSLLSWLCQGSVTILLLRWLRFRVFWCDFLPPPRIHITSKNWLWFLLGPWLRKSTWRPFSVPDPTLAGPLVELSAAFCTSHLKCAGTGAPSPCSRSQEHAPDLFGALFPWCTVASLNNYLLWGFQMGIKNTFLPLTLPSPYYFSIL